MYGVIAAWRKCILNFPDRVTGFDARYLASAIIAHPNDIERAFAAYEAKMFPRARKAAAESAAGLELAFESNAPQAMLDFFTPKG